MLQIVKKVCSRHLDRMGNIQKVDSHELQGPKGLEEVDQVLDPLIDFRSNINFLSW